MDGEIEMCGTRDGQLVLVQMVDDPVTLIRVSLAIHAGERLL